MIALYPILGALALGSGTILERSVLRKKKIKVTLYQTLSFLSIIVCLLPFIYFFWRVDPSALTSTNILIFALVILVATTANLFIFYSLKWEKVTNLEPARVLEPLFTILLALVFSFFIDSRLYERNIHIIIPALIAALALVFSHIKKHHLTFNRYFISGIIGSFFFALELVLSRLILNFYSPITFYFIRCSAIFLISLIIFRPETKIVDKKIGWTIFITGVIWNVYRIALYYGYVQLGIIFTTLIMMLGPIFIYIFANKFLKEKLNWRNIVASFVIIACVVYALVF